MRGVGVAAWMLVVAVGAGSARMGAQAGHFPSNEDLRQLRGMGGPQLAPDGKHVVVTVQDSTAEGGRNHLWLLSTEGGAYRQLTFAQGEGGQGERSPAFLPDGSAVLFLARREGKSSLYRLPLDGGEPVALKIERAPATDEAVAAVDVGSYSVSPDGSMVAVVATDPEPASRARDRKEKRDVVWVEHGELAHRLYLLDVKTGKVRDAPTLVDIDSVAWAEASDRLLVLTHTRLRDLGPSAVGWIVAANEPAKQTKVAGLPETARRVAWTHAGDRLVVVAQCMQDAPEGCPELYTLELAGGKLHSLTGGLKDGTLSPQTLTVAADDRSVVVGLARGMHETAAAIDLATGQMKVLALGMPVVAGLATVRGQAAWVYLGGSSTAAPAVYVTSSLEQPGKRLVQPEMVPAAWTAVASKAVSWKRAGFTIEGLLYLPPQAAAGKVPLVVNVHGGPTGQFNDSYSPLTNLLVGQGWAVLLTNPRGSTGYGVAFEAANKDDMGNGDYLDIMAGVDEVIRTEPIDAAKLALIGYSYGGEMAGFVEGKTTRFKAIVSGAPVIDQCSEYGTESDSFGDRWFTGQPWRHFESAWRQSPLAYAEHAKTPFLLLQGETDTTDPEGQSKEMYRALRQEGVPVQMVLFPREDHGALGGNFAGRPSLEPWHGVIAREHMMGFLRDGFAGKL